ncbi:MAG: hypothetical protein CR989_00550 [Flavobacteriales bacterium]|nr:MAG: hypothetical protein CR989_00550 [Flavobacteriales bacterium]
MKKILLIAFVILTIIACKKEETKVDYAVLQGTVKNLEDEDVLTIFNYNQSFIDTLITDDKGAFNDTLTVSDNFYLLKTKNNFIRIYLQKGTVLNMNIDANNQGEATTVTGKDAEITKYVIAKDKAFTNLTSNPQEFYSLDPTTYKNKVSQLKDDITAILDTTTIHSDFKEKEKRNLHYSYLNQLKIYEGAHGYFTKNKDFSVSEDYTKELDSLDYTNEEDFVFSDSYRNLVRGYFMDKSEEITKKDSTISNDMAYLFTLRNIENETIKNDLAYNFAKYNITYTNDVESFYKAYQEITTNAAYAKKIEATYKKLKAIAPGEPSPKFVAYENYAGGTTSLDDLKGKYVYIDVWATWCGPCVAEIPSLKKVEKQYHGKNIEFVSISIDEKKSYDKWKAMIKEKELGGIQLFADNAWQSNFITDYQIMSIPRFILINPEGKIINSNAPRPSNPKLIDLFKELEI